MRQTTTYLESIQKLADEYLSETGQDAATTREFALWAVQNGKWEAPPDIILRTCRGDFARALREQYITNEQGQPVRAKHVARIRKGDEQIHLWADIRRAPRKHMQVAFQQRREQVVGDCSQLKRDVDYYNSMNAKEQPIQLLLDFTEDVAESEALVGSL